jgi:hypothetical protein
MAKRHLKSPRVPPKQLKMPASFSSDGERMVNLEEVMDDNVATLNLPQLSRAQQAELVAKRIELQPEFNVTMVGAGKIDKNRAIAEVRADSEIGRTLIEIEQRYISNLVESAQSQKASSK